MLIQNSKDKITVGPKLIERYGRKVEKIVSYVSATENRHVIGGGQSLYRRLPSSTHAVGGGQGFGLV